VINLIKKKKTDESEKAQDLKKKKTQIPKQTRSLRLIMKKKAKVSHQNSLH